MTEQDFDDGLYNCKLAEQAERYEDMMKFLDAVVNKSTELTKEERNLMSIAYKGYVGARRSSWRAVSAIEQNTKYKGFLDVTKKYKQKIEAELVKACQAILDIINNKLYQKASTPENQVFYLKMKGDYYRYLAEVASSDKLHTAADKALESYNAATDLALAKLSPTHPVRLGLALNFSVFYFEVLSNIQQASKLAKSAFDGAIANVDSIDNEQYKEATAIIQLLRDNLTLWKTDKTSDNEEREEEVVHHV